MHIHLCKMRRHATPTMIAAVLCLLLFSGRLAAAEKTFGGGGGAGGYAGLDAGGGQQQQQPQPPEVSGEAGSSYSTTPSEAAPSTPAASDASPTTPAAAAEAATSTPAAVSDASPTTPAAAAEAATSTPAAAASDASPTTPAAAAEAATAAGGGYGGGLDPAGDPEVGLNEKAIKEILDEHNLFRAKEKAGLPPLTWNATLAKWSQQYADTTLKGSCQQIHSSSPYGENLMEGTPGLTWKITVDGWSEEKKNYHYESDTCDPGKMCGHYKAVVWKDTTSVGCGRIKCNSGDTIIMCSYWPPGNYDGVKPY